MSQKQKSRKPRRFFTEQTLQQAPFDLWLDPVETHHLRDSVRLKSGDDCLVTDGRGGEAEAVVGEFAADGRVCLRIERVFIKTGLLEDTVPLKVFPVMLRKGKTDFLVEKAQELGVREFCAITSEHCEVKIASEKTEKIIERWNRIAREASKQSGSLKLLRIGMPQSLREAIAGLSADDPVVIFHPGPDSIPFPQWLGEIQGLGRKIQTLNLFIGPEGGFSEDEVRWIRWHRREKNLRFVALGKVLFKADTVFVGIVAALRFSGVLSEGS